MELSLIGLNAAGKTSLVNVIATGQFSEDMIPTVGFNMRKMTKGNVSIKLWDLGGQTRFRSMWERYCRGVNAIVYVPRTRRPLWPLPATFFSRRGTLKAAGPAGIAPDGPSARRRFVVDAADHANIEIARSELHNLLRKPDAKENPLAGIPLLVRLLGLPRCHASVTACFSCRPECSPASRETSLQFNRTRVPRELRKC